MVLNTEWAQVEVIDLINDGSGLAFGIIGGRSTGVVVKTILPGGVADRDGRLQSGDHILQIGEVNLRGLGSEQVASVLRQCGVHVRMVVARPVESTTAEYQALGSHAPIVPTKILGDPVELDRHLIENGYAETLANQQPPSNYSTPFIYTGQQSDIQLHPISGIVDIVKDPLPIGNAPLPSLQIQVLSNTKMLPLDMALQKPDLPETEVYNVELKKDDLGLGITVAGYVCEKEEISGVFVKSISKGSAADLVKNIRINDRIIEVDGISVIGFTNHQAVELLRNTGSLVTIKLERYLRGPKFEQLQQAIRANELRPASPPSPSASSLQKVPLSLVHMSYLGIEPEMESRTSLDVDSTILLDGLNEEREIVIDGSVERRASGMSSLEYVVKWREIFDEDVQIVVARMHKEPNSGLGISLEGTVDVEDGREVRPHHYIRNILPDGPVGRNGILQSGDELLEVNEHQLLGLNHMDVVAILKRLPDYVCFVCARYLVPTMARVIDTSQRIEAFQARKILAGSLQTLIPSNENRMVKAKSETSIASSAASGAITGSRSRSLELVAGLPMWSEEATVVELNKGDNGLGFSILDYQDPLNSSQTVIVIRSLVPGGVAQTDGRLIPGDRLLAVNDINVEHATLDRAVQVLKAAQKGTVKITVAKPLTTNDSNISHDTEDDQTCFDEFQECLEEYEECLELVQICIDDDRSFNYSPCTSQVEDFGQKTTDAQDNNLSHIFENTYLQLTMLKKTSMDDSDLDISFKSTNGNQLDNNKLNELDNKKCLSNCAVIKNNNNKNQKTASLVLNKSDSLTQSDKVSNITQSSNLSEKDGYETCIDESLSEDSAKLKTTILATTPTKNQETETATDNDNHNKVQKTNDDPEEITPTNSKINILDQLFIEVPDSTQPPTPATASLTTTITLSEPCLNTNPFNSPKHICLDTKYDDGLKSYDNRNSGGDEFFLVQYPEDNTKEVSKCSSEPNVLETVTDVRKGVYRRCLREYYNDYEDCLEALAESKDVGKEVNEDDIFSDILLPFKSRSAPDIMDSSFVMLTYDPGPELRNRRKSAFVAGYQTSESEYPLQMTVIRPIDNEYGTLKGIHVDNMLEKHWGSTHTVEVYREPNKSLGISIVGGKVDLNYSEKSTDTVLGIFVKNVVPNSPAGKTGHLKTGDRILEVSGVDLRQANHETAVQAIRNASNPVQFVVQSIIPWKSQIEDTNDTTCPSPFPSPVSKAPPQTFNVELQETVIPPPPAPPSVVITDEDTLPSQKVLSKNESYEGSDDDEDEDDVRDLEGRTVSDKGHQIDRASAANFKRSKEEIDADPDEEDDYGYTMNKVKKKYASLGHTILMVQLERSNQGLGLSLAGHKDRNCMAVFVCGLNPTGMAYKTGGIQIGDEILEVNGVVLHGRCHLNASAIIKGLSGPIFKVIVLRRKTAIDDIAVKPITQFPVSLAEEASEEQFSASYPNVRTIAIKKQGNQSLGIMIIEGKHAEVGQGIFISDIQEGSSAEKAGLEIGEMILAVNKDTLVGSNYDTAANLLKRTEGLVTLVVSNPGKKDYAIPPPSNAVEPTIHKSNALKPTVQPSRPTTPVPDPTTCQVTPGKDSVIEITTDNKGLGICFVGGKDTLLPTGIIVVEVYPGGTAEKDGRLQPGDQIIDVNGTSLKDVTNTTASQALRQTLPKVKLTIFRPNKIEYTVIDVDLMKKPGKAIGLSVVAKKSGKGVYVADIINGSAADVDGRIIKGDLLISVNGQNVESATAVEAGAILKTVMGKVSLKLHRYKPIAR